MRPLPILPVPRPVADEFSLVLDSARIPHRLEPARRGWMVHTPLDRRDEAMEELRAYMLENPWEPDGEEAEEEHEALPDAAGKYSGLYVAALLAVVYLATGPVDLRPDLVRILGANAEVIRSGQIWRAATALTLHLDFLHLLGNMVGIALFGTAVARMAGRGMGWSLVVAGGILGNLINAWVHQTAHVSVGASTSVFAAIGILGGLRLVPWPRGRGKNAPWVILGAGLALLGLLGSGGERTDIFAHLFGYLSGVGLGMGHAALFPQPVPPRWQAGALATTAAILAGAWGLAWIMA
ncbi:MAG: rhomboid family intramembrane serine protease [Proteobacteria bacterium]|nr:rhomboid family intramembrane serine protease [Pseudomonadota bacterium]